MGCPPWSEERSDRLRQLWADGLSASAIAADLGGVTRSAVLGKVCRLGLSNRQSRVHNVQQRRKPTRESDGCKRNGRRKAKPQSITRFLAIVNRHDPGMEDSLSTPLIDDLAIPEAQRRSLLELDSKTCHWPIGDPAKPGFYFCGGLAVEGFPYCIQHSRLAYRALALVNAEAAE